MPKCQTRPQNLEWYPTEDGRICLINRGGSAKFLSVDDFKDGHRPTTSPSSKDAFDQLAPPEESN